VSARQLTSGGILVVKSQLTSPFDYTDPLTRWSNVFDINRSLVFVEFITKGGSGELLPRENITHYQEE
jgi:hypothetical protein